MPQFAPVGGPGQEDFLPAKVKSFDQDQTEQHVFDLAGNVSEMCLDVYKPYSSFNPSANSKTQPLDDPGLSGVAEPPEEQELSMSCGEARSSRSERKASTFYRAGGKADESPQEVGFRLVIECPPERQRPE